MKERVSLYVRLLALFAVLACFALPSSADESIAPAIIRVAATCDGATRYGTGFVVALSGKAAYAATAKHVVEGCETVEAVFQPNPGQRYPAQVHEMDNWMDLALLRVGGVPGGLKVLEVFNGSVEAGSMGDLSGFPLRSSRIRYEQVTLSNREGSSLSLTGVASGGNSGSPVMQKGRVVGMVVETHGGYPVAIPGLFLSSILDSWLRGRFVREPEMVAVPGSRLEMGSAEGDSEEIPVHAVAILPFLISKTEVTVAQYRACLEAKACPTPPAPSDPLCNWGHQDRDDHPMNCISWDEAQAYANWIDARLPSEAEWEFAARSGGQSREYPWGNESADCSRAVISEINRGSGCDSPGTWPVCSKPAGKTDQGLCDMAGNVWEWVEDDWHDDYTNAPSTSWPAWKEVPRSPNRVFRGGSWRNQRRDARVTAREESRSSKRYVSVGFRVARSLHSAP